MISEVVVGKTYMNRRPDGKNEVLNVLMRADIYDPSSFADLSTGYVVTVVENGERKNQCVLRKNCVYSVPSWYLTQYFEEVPE